MDFSNSMQPVARRPVSAQVLTGNGGMPPAAPGNVRASTATTESAQPAPATDSLSLSVKTVFRQQTALSLNWQGSSEVEPEDDGQASHDEHATEPGRIDAGFSQQLFSIVSVTRQAATSTEVVAADSAPVAASGSLVSASRELDSTLQLTTAEGDTVTVNLSRNQTVTAGRASNADGEAGFAGSASGTQISIRIEGELNEEESEAIEEVIEDVAKLAARLYSGEVTSAFARLQKLDVDAEQLTGIALSLSSRYAYTAVSTYTGVSATTAAVAGSAPSATPVSAEAPPAAVTAEAAPVAALPASPAETATGAVQQARQTVAGIAAGNVLDNPFASIRQLFAGLAEALSAVNPDIDEDQDAFVKQLLDGVIEDVAHDDEDEPEIA